VQQQLLPLLSQWLQQKTQADWRKSQQIKIAAHSRHLPDCRMSRNGGRLGHACSCLIEQRRPKCIFRQQKIKQQPG
jgi:hypothetical protein